MTGAAPSTWTVVSGTSRGSHHEVLSEPNQDALGCEHDSARGGLVISVADGHGSEHCHRSEIGSRMAVEAATRLGMDFLARYESSPIHKVLQGATTDLIPAIVEEWISKVSAHRLQVPVTGGEGFYEESPREQATLIPYGTTLLTALFGRDNCLVLQLGDGDVVAVDASGRVSKPVPPDPTLVGGVTTSLCCPDCASMFRVALIDLAETSLALLALSTDGYGNSFPDPEWPQRVGTDLLKHLIGNGPAWIQERLGNWLSQSAEVGGDDSSLIMAVRVNWHE